MLNALRALFRPARKAPEIPPALWEDAESSLTCLSHLDASERAALRNMALSFLDDKVFSGAHAYEPSDPARLSIALQACLPVLKLGLQSYAGWRGIIVYPGEFIIPRRELDENGVQHEYEEDALGEAWEGGPVVLTWFDDHTDYAGANVVIHEFVHKLDMLNGETDGLPPLHADMSLDAWQEAFEAAYADLCERVDAEAEIPLDPYAATHPAEFFAVASEAFFCNPEPLHAAYPRVYHQLAAFYRQHTLPHAPSDILV